MTAPLLILAGMAAALAFCLVGRAKSRHAFERALLKAGFRRADGGQGEIDFAVTLQWPENRGITYLDVFMKTEGDATATVANVRCWEATGARMGRMGAAMRSQEICQTVVAYVFPGRDVPRLCLCPRDWEDQFRNLHEGGAELSSGNASFDRAFFMTGPADADIGRILTQDILAALQSLPDFMLASGNSSVLLFRQAVMLPPDELTACIDLMDMIRRQMTGRTR